ncbi:MAG: hypothetical protein EBZ77_13755 [Chitinophagia bacterium]|nr:hypothetical protein [Chitinophagia bacterium]
MEMFVKMIIANFIVLALFSGCHVTTSTSVCNAPDSLKIEKKMRWSDQNGTRVKSVGRQFDPDNNNTPDTIIWYAFNGKAGKVEEKFGGEYSDYLCRYYSLGDSVFCAKSLRGLYPRDTSGDVLSIETYSETSVCAELMYCKGSFYELRRDSSITSAAALTELQYLKSSLIKYRQQYFDIDKMQ